MRVATIELFVDVKSSRSGRTDADAIMSAIRAAPAARRNAALAAIRVARELDPDAILCPGWTFIRGAPAAAVLRAAAGRARLFYEVLDYRGPEFRKETGRTLLRPKRFPWRSFVLDGEVTRELDPQILAVSADLDHREHATALADAIRVNRAVGNMTLLVCGEVNVMRRRRQDGAVIWEPLVKEAGLPDSALAERIVLNPAHTPNSSYVRNKWRAGPWRAIVCTANTLDRSKRGRRGFARPAHAVFNGKDSEGKGIAVSGSKSRVVVFDV